MNLLQYDYVDISYSRTYDYVRLACMYCNRTSYSAFYEHQPGRVRFYGCKECRRGAALVVEEEHSFGVVEDTNGKMLVFKWDQSYMDWTWVCTQEKTNETEKTT